MNLIKIFTSTFLLKGIFAISLFILILISGISYKHTLSLADSTESVVHTYKVNIQLEQLLSFVKDAEIGQRGFIITRDSSFLQPYNAAYVNVLISFAELNKLAANNIQQQNNLESLHQLIDSRFSNLETTFRVSAQIPVDKSLLKASMLNGKIFMDKIRFQVSKMIELDMAYLNERQAKYDHEISFTPLFTLLLMLFALFIFIFSYWEINKDLNILKITNANLLIKTESMSHAEEIGGISSWQWNLESNKLIFSDNQYLLLGCEPQSFEPTIEKFLEFVHPKDKHLVIDGEIQVLENNKYPTSFFRIIRKDGEVRHFKSLSKLITDINDKKTLIGINFDVTEQHKTTLALEERNKELEQSNKELASFNHVASHDLQEPLRIIQIYISRLIEKEDTTMTDKGKEYLDKIKMSVTRMRTLIEDLLLFSRTNKIEKVFEKTNLNLLLENSKLDLAGAIEEKNAVIYSEELPTINVIPFQIQQLFTNIIGNSIKYSKTNIAPCIKISCEKIVAKDQPELKTKSTKKYFKISISDNGLGFEQQYAESIFILFQRLHNDKEYIGTGIGLSICKKIVENHSGFIISQGELNIGATFSVFLPS